MARSWGESGGGEVITINTRTVTAALFASQVYTSEKFTSVYLPVTCRCTDLTKSTVVPVMSAI